MEENNIRIGTVVKLKPGQDIGFLGFSGLEEGLIYTVKMLNCLGQFITAMEEGQLVGIWGCYRFDILSQPSYEAQLATEPEVKDLKYDQGKLRFDLILPEFEEGMAKIMTMGAAKYAPNSWQNVEGAEDRYYAALKRHINQYGKGEGFDEESKESHLLHAACNLMFLYYFEEKHKGKG